MYPSTIDANDQFKTGEGEFDQGNNAEDFSTTVYGSTAVDASTTH